jgi:hypothetical protein
MQLAEAGVAHAVGNVRRELRKNKMSRLLRGNDSASNTADDGLLWNYASVPVGDWIPAGGRTVAGGTYFVSFLDDPQDPIASVFDDGNSRIVARCRGVTNDGASAEIDAVIAATPLPGIATEGNLGVPGNPTILGPCGSLHSNGNLALGGSSTVAQFVSASGTITGDAQLPGGQPAPEISPAPPVDIPALNPMDHCGNADYRLRADGWVLEVATGLLYDARSTEKFGFKRAGSSPVLWDQAGAAFPGTFCVEGNVKVGGNPGTPGVPLPMSLIASGSIEISGNPYLSADDEDNIQFLAGGDLKLNGSPTVGTNNFSGLMYAGSQCQVSGDPTLGGQLMCDNKANPAGSINLFSDNQINGNPTITFDCDGNIFNKRRVLFWYQRIGS